MLSPGEVWELQSWLNQHEQDEAKVDMELKGVVESGTFDELIEEAIADERATLK